MKQAQELYQLLKNLGDKGMSAVTLATVKSVDETKCTCVVIVDEMEIANVRLKATLDSGAGFKVFPKVGSFVLIQRIADGDFAVIMTSEIEHVKWNVGNNGVLIDLADLITIRNNNFSLLQLLLKFIDICMNETHLSNAGPTVRINMADQAKFQNLQNEFKQLLKN